MAQDLEPITTAIEPETANEYWLKELRSKGPSDLGKIFDMKGSYKENINETKALISMLMKMIEYLIADNARLKHQLQRYEKRINVQFGGTQKLNEFKKV